MNSLKLAITFISVPIVLGGGLFMLSPAYQIYQTLQTTSLNKENELLQKEEYYRQLNLINDELKNYEQEIAKINYGLSKDIRVPSFLGFIQKAASENSLLVKEIGSFSDSAENKGKKNENLFQTANLSFSVFGKYPDLLNFLRKLEKSARVANVSLVEFSGFADAAKENEAKEEFDFKLGVDIFSWPEEIK